MLFLHWVSRSHYGLGLLHGWLLRRSCQLLLLHRVHHGLGLLHGRLLHRSCQLLLLHRIHHGLTHWHLLGDHGHYTCDISIARRALESHRAIMHSTDGTHFNSIWRDLGLLIVRLLLLRHRLTSSHKTSRVVLDVKVMLASMAPFAIRSRVRRARRSRPE
jgi:hypothetical protein